jgi:hypothetical protein
MNIIEQEDLIKGLPDQALFQQAQNPNSQVPQFLVVSEIQRRTDMRKRFEAAEAQPQATVTDQILMEGLGATQPAPPPQGSMPPAGMPAPPSPQLPLEGSSPLMGQGMAAGGILGFNPGGVVRMQSGTQVPLISTEKYGDIPARYSSQGVSWLEERDAAQAEKERRANFLRNLTPSQSGEYLRLLNKGATSEEALNLIMGDASQISPNALEAYTGVSLNEEADAEEQFQLDPAALEAYTGIDFGAVTEYDETGTGIPFGDGQPQDTTQDAGDASTVIAETEQYEAPDILNRNLVTQVGETALEGELLESQKTDSEDYLQTLLDRYESIGESRQGRIDTRRSESQDLIEEIRNEGRRDAFSAAMMQLGAGIAGGDLSGGLQRAGDVATSTNALARDAARAEQRGMRDYEEAALSGIDELGMQQSALAYEANKEATARSEDVRRWEAEHGLSKQSVEIDAAFRQAGLDMEAAKFNEDRYIGRQGLAQSIRKIDADIQANTDTTKREAMRTFTSVLDSITDLVEDLPTGTSLADRERIRDQQQRRILTALRAELGEDFYDAFMAEYTPVRDGDTPTPAGVISYENYNIDNN